MYKRQVKPIVCYYSQVTEKDTDGRALLLGEKMDNLQRTFTVPVLAVTRGQELPFTDCPVLREPTHRTGTITAYVLFLF